MTSPIHNYGIVANVSGADRVFRAGAKAWLCGGTGGAGYERFKWVAVSHRGRIVEKWAPTIRFTNFRAAWIPEHMRDRVFWFRGTKEEMEKVAVALNAFVAAAPSVGRSSCGLDSESSA